MKRFLVLLATGAVVLAVSSSAPAAPTTCGAKCHPGPPPPPCGKTVCLP